MENTSLSHGGLSASDQFQLLVACSIRRCLRYRPDRRHHAGVTATPAGDAPFHPLHIDASHARNMWPLCQGKK